jgi:hypothetical protein
MWMAKWGELLVSGETEPAVVPLFQSLYRIAFIIVTGIFLWHGFPWLVRSVKLIMDWALAGHSLVDQVANRCCDKALDSLVCLLRFIISLIVGK